MLKHHLNGGVKKGALLQEDADKKFSAWLEEKSSKIQSKIDGLDKDKAESLAKRLELEKELLIRNVLKTWLQNPKLKR